MKRFIKYATKAPSGHTSQPWKFKVQENNIKILPDYENSLPIVDPNNRELFISLGCATENICAAASVFGYKTSWEVHRSVTGSDFINIDFEKTEISFNRGILESIDNRQTNRSLFNDKIIGQKIIDELSRLPIEENIEANCLSDLKSGVYLFLY